MPVKHSVTSTMLNLIKNLNRGKTMTKVILTQELLKELIHYNPETGIFTWLERDRKYFKSDRSCKTWNSRFSSKTAGCTDKSGGYHKIRLLDGHYVAHRLAFLYIEGCLPKVHTDHINGIENDNSWRNIRHVTHQDNMKNKKRRSTNKSGITGVGWSKIEKKWRSRIQGWNGEAVFLGYFDDIEDAKIARKEAEIKYGYHPNHGRI